MKLLSSSIMMILNRTLLELVFVLLVLSCVQINAKPTTAATATATSESTEPIITSQQPNSIIENNKDRQLFDLDRENYDPYDAQASAVAFRRYKEAQALKGRYAQYEDPLMSSSSNVEEYETKFYDPFFYNNNANKQQNQHPRSYPNAVNDYEFRRRSGRRYLEVSQPGDDENPMYLPRFIIREAPSGEISGSPSRSRRNTANSAAFPGTLNNLLTEDVYFFRRDPSIAARSKERLDDYKKSPYFYRESPEMLARYRGKPVGTTTDDFFNPSSKYNDYYASRIVDLPASRQNTIIGRPYYAPKLAPNQIYDNYIDGPRIPLLPGGREGTHGVATNGNGVVGVPGLNGWSVQVGTQLQVQDDGRTRNPNRFYVRDERPHSIARYPHYRDRQ